MLPAIGDPQVRAQNYPGYVPPAPSWLHTVHQFLTFQMSLSNVYSHHNDANYD